MSSAYIYTFNIILVLILVLLNAFFVVSEFSIVKIRRTKLRSFRLQEPAKIKLSRAKALIASLQAEVAALAATGVAIPTSDPEVEIELIVEEDNPIDGESEEQFPSAEESQEELEELDIVQTPIAEEPIAEPIPVVEEPTAESEPEPVVELPIVEPVVGPTPAPAPEPAPAPAPQPAPRPVPQQTSLFGTAVEDIRQAISLGDRFLFQRELFAGNGELMQKTLDEINTLSSLGEAMGYVRDNFDWDMDSTAVQLFENVLKRRFS